MSPRPAGPKRTSRNGGHFRTVRSAAALTIADRRAANGDTSKTGDVSITLGRRQRTVVVAVVAMRVMKMTSDAIIDMVTMRHRLVAAARAMNMTRLMPAATMVGGANFGVLAGYLNHVLVDMIAMRMVEVPVMQIVDVAAVAHGRMSASRPVLVSMVGMGWGRASRHERVPFLCPRSVDTPVRFSAAWSIALRISGSTCSSARA